MNIVGKVIIIIVLVVILLILSAGGVLAFFQGQSLPLIHRVVTVPFFEKSETEVLSAMQQKMSDLSTAHYAVNIATILPIKDTSLVLQTQADFDGGLQDGLLGQLLLKNEIDLQGQNFLLNIDLRLTQDKSYFKIYEIPAIPFMDLYYVKDKWYELSNAAMVENFIGSIISNYEQIMAAGNAKVIRRLPDETVNGQVAYHYLVQLDWQGQSQVEIWVGKTDMYLYQAKLIESVNNQIESFSLVISDFNKQITLAEPSQAKSIDQFGKDLFGQTNILDIPIFGYVLGLDTSDYVSDMDQDNLYFIWEQLFKTNPGKADTDEDGFLDGEEIRNGYNPNGSGLIFSAGMPAADEVMAFGP